MIIPILNVGDIAMRPSDIMDHNYISIGEYPTK